jgi:hypothetical protein
VRAHRIAIWEAGAGLVLATTHGILVGRGARPVPRSGAFWAADSAGPMRLNYVASKDLEFSVPAPLRNAFVPPIAGAAGISDRSLDFDPTLAARFPTRLTGPSGGRNEESAFQQCYTKLRTAVASSEYTSNTVKSLVI